MTIEPPFNSEQLKSLLLLLDFHRRLAFGLSCAERLYPNYLAFVHAHHWGDAAAVRQALDLGWQALDEQPGDQSDMAHICSKVQAAAPDTEDFGTVLGSLALDAANAAELILLFLDERSVDHIIEIASLCCDTVAIYVSSRETTEPTIVLVEPSTTLDPLMQEELRKQREDARSFARMTLASIRHLKASRRQIHRSNVGLLTQGPERGG
jgi:uncharacterized protein YjaG (DUF416 family)